MIASRGSPFLSLLPLHLILFLFQYTPRTRALFVARSAYAILRRPRPPLGQEVTGARSPSERNCTSEQFLLERSGERKSERRERGERERERSAERGKTARECCSSFTLPRHFLSLHPQPGETLPKINLSRRIAPAENGYKLNEGRKGEEEKARGKETSAAGFAGGNYAIPNVPLPAGAKVRRILLLSMLPLFLSFRFNAYLRTELNPDQMTRTGPEKSAASDISFLIRRAKKFR